LKKPAIWIHSAALATSASSNTITGALPPSSRCTRFSVSAAFFAISRPVELSPVSETIPTSGCLTIASPTGSPSPVTTLKTPGGKTSASAIHCANFSSVSGVFSAGLMTMVLPAASAGPSFHAAMYSG
jgi:hypothetical protein